MENIRTDPDCFRRLPASAPLFIFPTPRPPADSLSALARDAPGLRPGRSPRPVFNPSTTPVHPRAASRARLRNAYAIAHPAAFGRRFHHPDHRVPDRRPASRPGSRSGRHRVPGRPAGHAVRLHGRRHRTAADGADGQHRAQAPVHRRADPVRPVQCAGHGRAQHLGHGRGALRARAGAARVLVAGQRHRCRAGRPGARRPRHRWWPSASWRRRCSAFPSAC